MIRTLYIIILSYFLAGGAFFYVIGKKLPKEKARHNRIKFYVYFLIINVLFWSIVVKPFLFTLVAAAIVALGCYEMVKVYLAGNRKHKKSFILSFLLYVLLAFGLMVFSTLPQPWILFTFLLLSVLDSFSQIFGQLLGKTHILKKISPGKTLEGFLGGAATTLVTSLLLHSLMAFSRPVVLLLAAGIVAWAFLGDLGASAYKRTYEVKDFSKLLPGHGGVLDRFDSLLAAGAWMAFVYYILQMI
ncbi:MAG: phosphatidate cytidylyltransferase [Bacteroidales bacterium]|jgi:phosphatidate cytidylyltransferase